jgi:APA family basic amino acid/polyamine antiporter
MAARRDPGSGTLVRSLRLPHATAMVVGTIIGASIFVQPSEMSGALPSIPALLAAWALAGLLTIAGALICAELASAYPQTGGVYVFLNRTLSPAVGFLWAWAMFWSVHSGIIAAIAMIFARYVGHFVPLSAWSLRLVAIAAILALSAVNYIGVKHGSRLQAAFTLGKVVAIGAMILAGFAFGAGLPHFTGSQPVPDLLGQFPRAVAAGLFAFGGWHMVTYVAGETVEARRTIPAALAIGAAVVTACYVALNLVYLYVLPLGTVISSTRVAADAAVAVLGAGGAAIMSGLVVLSTFGALGGIVLLGPRVYYSLAVEHKALAWLGAVHPRFHTPHRAIVVQAVWSSVLVGTGTYRALFTRVVYTEWIFFALMAVGLLLARRRPDYPARYLSPGYPAIPVLFALVSAALALYQVVSNPLDGVVGLLLVLIGLPVYYWIRPRATTHT